MTSEEREFIKFVEDEFERLRWALLGILPDPVPECLHNDCVENLLEFAKGNILGNMPITRAEDEERSAPSA